MGNGSKSNHWTFFRIYTCHAADLFWYKSMVETICVSFYIHWDLKLYWGEKEVLRSEVSLYLKGIFGGYCIVIIFYQFF